MARNEEKKLINANNGDLTIIQGDLIINNNLTKTAFLNSISSKEAIIQVINSYTHCYLDSKIIENENFRVKLVFEPSGRLLNVFLSLSAIDSSWDNWSESREMECKELHDKWLKEKLGIPPYDFWWGTISSEYDPRSGSSTIVFSYKHNRPS